MSDDREPLASARDPAKITFPCDYPISVMGDAHEEFVAVVTDVVQRFDPDLQPDTVRVRDSRQGRYRSVRLVIRATGETQLRALHEALKATGQVKMVLQGAAIDTRARLLVRDYLDRAGSGSTVACEAAYRRMQQHTATRDRHDPSDECWLLEHAPVYTLGQAADETHIHGTSAIPVVRLNRGGQVTYHGPGQIMLYTLIDLSRQGLGVRGLVSCLENAVVALLAGYGISARSEPSAPGVYVAGAKIAALGLRVSRGCSYHGLCFNHSGDLSPFHAIDPCGYRGMQVTSLAELLDPLPDLQNVGIGLVRELSALLDYTEVEIVRENWPGSACSDVAG